MRLAFYKGRRTGWPGAFDAVVRWWCRSPYSHVELVFADGVAGSSSARDGGVRLKRIDFHPDRWDFIDVHGDEAHARRWFEAHAGQGYDYAGLFGFVFRRTTGRFWRWFCVEAVSAALQYEDSWRFDLGTFASVARRALLIGRPS